MVFHDAITNRSPDKARVSLPSHALTLDPATPDAPSARFFLAGTTLKAPARPSSSATFERGGYAIPLPPRPTTIMLKAC